MKKKKKIGPAEAFHMAVSAMTAIALSGSLAVVAVSPVSANAADLFSRSSDVAAPSIARPLARPAAPSGSVLPPLWQPAPDAGPPLSLARFDTIPADVELGEATWYGEQFHGRTTASGEVMDQEALIAAHLSHRFGTHLRVTNQSNGRSVVVRVVDRGPHAPGKEMPAIIDLSRAAAREIDMLEVGRVIVTLEVVTAPGGR